MAAPGDVFEHPRSGTRIVFRATAAETHGRAVVLEFVLEPNGWRPRLHVHPRQRQRVEVIAGSAGVQVGRRHSVVGTGARLDFPPRIPHRIWNAGDEPLQLVVETTPACRLEPLLVAWCTGRGRLRLATAYLDTIRPALGRVSRRRA